MTVGRTPNALQTPGAIPPLQPDQRVVEAVDLRVESINSGADIVDEVSLSIAPGEVLGLVGESGSGKTTLGLALMGYSRRGARIVRGQVRLEGRDILAMDVEELRSLWGSKMSYVPQDPRAAINPSLRIGTQLSEILNAHVPTASAAERHERILETLHDVLLPSDERFLRRFPHQLSGGQLQRVGLAMAFACRPRIIVFDEPTTGLDVTTQRHVMQTIRHLCQEHHVAALYVTHDLAVVASIATRVGVMYAGRLVEVGPADRIFKSASHPYTRRLIAAAPDESGNALVGIPGSAPRPGQRPNGCSFAPRCAYASEPCLEAFPTIEAVSAGHEVRCFRHLEVAKGATEGPRTARKLSDVPDDEAVLHVSGIEACYGDVSVIRDLSLNIRAHECLALVGESGSGKSTLAHCIVGLHPQFTGDLVFQGRQLAKKASDRDRETRRQIQYVFQNPYGSLNPRRTVGQNVALPLNLFYDLSKREVQNRVGEELERVSLSASFMRRYPDELSGGERQRVAIARALACKPTLLICDEITSALDVSVQAAIIELLHALQRDLGLAMLFVTHNLPLVRTIAQRLAVMTEGRIVETGYSETIIAKPQADYTRRLLSDSPVFLKGA
jgi:peptide/nickel transport system ATP-binding protein